MAVLYYGGILAIIVLEIAEGVTYAQTSTPHKASKTFYFILVFLLAFCLGILFDSLRRLTSVVKAYEAMSID